MKKIMTMGGIMFVPIILNIPQRVTGKVKGVLKSVDVVKEKFKQGNLY